MTRACTRFVIQAAISLCTVALLPSGALNAQQTLVATARMSPRALKTGPDSGKYLLSLQISGIPEVALRSLKHDQLLLVDSAGRAYTPSGVGYRTVRTEQTSPVAAYLGTSKNTAKPEYWFLVAPGSRTFELRVAGLKPVRVSAPLPGFAQFWWSRDADRR